ncbi:CocE/NonD family hydrolase [Nocardioides speluncae]|uniref:CocE/NonD family hydrolase n=1 Tax=Nocardioides speluncae TaxID=2670337 RepID=UPI000D6870B2|nr:CocE/NonD family hydrolase [Nocardioides speluncae]
MRVRRAVAAAVTIAVGVGVVDGAVAAGPAAPAGDEDARFAPSRLAPGGKHVWVTVPGVDSDRDGRADRVHVSYRLPKRPGRVPAILEASPYFGGFVEGVANHGVDHPLHVPAAPVPTSYEELFLSKGYAYVMAESIGSGRSTGCPVSGGVAETKAMAAVVRWLGGKTYARDAGGRKVKAFWSTGRSGMIGVSYNGTLANAVAATGVPGLKAIVPISAISDWHDYYRSQGAVRAPGGYQGEDADVLARFVLTRKNPGACRQVIARLAREQDRTTGDMSSFWASRSYRPHARKVKAAVLSLHGLDDWNVMSDQSGRWLRELDRAGVPHQAWWHAEGHGDPLFYNDPQWRRQLVDWMDRWVKGRANGVMRRPGSVVSDGGRHWSHQTWPAPGSRTVSLRPAPGGRTAGPLGLGEPAYRSERLYDDARFSLAQLAKKPTSRHRLLYRTPRLRAPLELSGLASANLTAAFGARAANVSVGLAVIAPSGRTRLLSEGWLDPQNVAGTPWRGRALQPGTPYSMTVRFDMVLQHRIAAGSRLALVVASSDRHYTIRPKPGTSMTVRLGRTALNLPVIGGAGAVEAALGG